MKIKVSLTDHGEWSDCWLKTEYIETGTGVDKLETQFRCFIYPTTWSSLYQSDGFAQYSSCYSTIDLRSWVEECKEYLKPKKNDRDITALQKTCKFLSRVFTW